MVVASGTNSFAKEMTIRKRIGNMSRIPVVTTWGSDVRGLTGIPMAGWFLELFLDNHQDVHRMRYNKRVEDFPSLRDYNDYLEEVEDMIVNLVDGKDVLAIEAAIARYQRENAEQIMNAQARKAEEFAAALAASRGQPASSDVDMTTGTSSQFGVSTSEGHYVPAVAGGPIPQPRPTQPLPMGSGDDLHAYHMDDEDTMRLKAELGGKAGGWSLEISRKRALEEAFGSIWI